MSLLVFRSHLNNMKMVFLYFRGKLLILLVLHLPRYFYEIFFYETKKVYKEIGIWLYSYYLLVIFFLKSLYIHL